MTGEQRRALAAAVERILPSEDGPGAVETGAVAYIERLLDTDLFRSWQPQGRGFSSLVSLARLD